jgi:hypothetical protein
MTCFHAEHCLTLQVLAAKLFTIKLCYLSALTWHLYVLLIDGRAEITVDGAQRVRCSLFTRCHLL